MINANDLRKVEFSKVQNGYSIEDVNSTIDEAAKTIEAYVNENTELYNKLEVLAAKIEEYREEEDSIKTALITAQKMADKIESESKSEAETRLKESNEAAEKIISDAKAYSSVLIKEKTEEANALISEAEIKSNDAINSSKIVAQNILDQAKEISDDLITKSKEEKEAYELLINNLKEDAASFIEKLKILYIDQLDSLNSAKFEGATASDEEVNFIHREIESLVSEIDEIKETIPDDSSLEEDDLAEEITDDFEEDFAEGKSLDEDSAEEDIAEEPAEDFLEEEPAEEEFAEEEFAEEELAEENIAEEPAEEESAEEESAEEESAEEETFEITEEYNKEDAMEAVEAFSKDEITPIDTSKAYIPEIDEEAEMEENEKDESLFKEDTKLPFENYFNVNNNDAHGDKTQTISLIPPEDDDDDDEPKFKGFFKKRN